MLIKTVSMLIFIIVKSFVLVVKVLFLKIDSSPQNIKFTTLNQKT